MTRKHTTACMFLLMLAWPMVVTGGPTTGKYLYTEPDAAAGGGIKGEIVMPKKPIAAVFALPPDEPRFVYKGKITGPKNRGFLFEGLPVRQYDLIVVFDDEFYEGLRLNRGENTLSQRDIKLVENILNKSEPFFNEKVIHRLEGKTGYKQEARCICTFLRAKGAALASIGYSGHRRSFKLALLMDVGPGWQVVRTREIYTIFAKPEKGIVRHAYREYLGGIRVIDNIKDIGKISLSKVN